MNTRTQAIACETEKRYDRMCKRGISEAVAAQKVATWLLIDIKNPELLSKGTNYDVIEVCDDLYDAFRAMGMDNFSTCELDAILEYYKRNK